VKIGKKHDVNILLIYSKIVHFLLVYVQCTIEKGNIFNYNKLYFFSLGPALRFNHKYLHLGSDDEQKSYRVGTTTQA